jgi:hypothetical protein
MESKKLLSGLYLRMTVGVALIMMVWLTYLGARYVQLMHADRVQENTVRSQLMAAELGRVIQRAVSYGIPLAQLEGVDTVFKDRIQTNSFVVEIALLDADGRRLLPRGALRSQGERVAASIETDAGNVGKVVVFVRSSSWWDVLPLPLPAAVLLLLLSLLLLAQTLRFGLLRGIMLRESGFRQALDLAAQRDYTQMVRESERKSFDQRMSLLGVQIRDVNERHMRLSRLIRSLQETEPSDEKRLRLERLRLKLQKTGLFAPSKPGVFRCIETVALRQMQLFLVTVATSVHLFLAGMSTAWGSGQASALIMVGFVLGALLWALPLTHWQPARSGRAREWGGLVLLTLAPLGLWMDAPTGVAGSTHPVLSFFHNLTGTSGPSCLVLLVQLLGSVLYFKAALPVADTSRGTQIGWPQHVLLVLAAATLVGGVLTWFTRMLLGTSAEWAITVLLMLVALRMHLLEKPPAEPSTDAGQADVRAVAKGSGRQAWSWAPLGFLVAMVAPLDGAPMLQAGLAAPFSGWVLALTGSALGVLACTWWPRRPRLNLPWFALVIVALVYASISYVRWGAWVEMITLVTLLALVTWAILARLSQHGGVSGRWLCLGAVTGWMFSWACQTDLLPAWAPTLSLFLALLLFELPRWWIALEARRAN